MTRDKADYGFFMIGIAGYIVFGASPCGEKVFFPRLFLGCLSKRNKLEIVEGAVKKHERWYEAFHSNSIGSMSVWWKTVQWLAVHHRRYE